MHARKLLLAVLIGGPVLGTMAGLAVDPTMQPPPEPPWRHPAKAVTIPAEGYFQIDPPQDLSPYGSGPRSAVLARRFAADAAPHDVAIEPAPATSEDVATLTAEAADQARLAANPDPAADVSLAPAPAPMAPEPDPQPEAEPPAVVL